MSMSTNSLGQLHEYRAAGYYVRTVCDTDFLLNRLKQNKNHIFSSFSMASYTFQFFFFMFYLFDILFKGFYEVHINKFYGHRAQAE